MQHNNIPYEYNEWLYNDQKCSAYTCKYFNFYPYHIISFSTDTEQEMKDKIETIEWLIEKYKSNKINSFELVKRVKKFLKI